MNPPIPCMHCGYNFMRQSPRSEEKLCNSCCIRENLRNPKQEPKKMNIDILIKCPCDMHKEIEEACLEMNIGLSEYFLALHEMAANADSSAVKARLQSTAEGTAKKAKGCKK